MIYDELVHYSVFQESDRLYPYGVVSNPWIYHNDGIHSAVSSVIPYRILDLQSFFDRYADSSIYHYGERLVGSDYTIDPEFSFDMFPRYVFKDTHFKLTVFILTIEYIC